MKVCYVSHERVGDRALVTVQIRCWWLFWKTKTYLRSEREITAVETNRHTCGMSHFWWFGFDGENPGCSFSRQLSRVYDFACVEEQRTQHLLGENVVPIRRPA